MYVKYAINKLQYDDFKKYYKRFWQEDDINEKELWNKIQLLKKNLTFQISIKMRLY